MLRKIIVISLAIILGVIACALWATDYFSRDRNIPVVASNQTQQDIPQTTIIAEDLEVPWDLAFLPDGNIIATERKGNILLINTTAGNKILLTTIPDVVQNNESGLHGIALHPNFATNHYIYVYYTHKSDGTNIQSKVVRYTFNNNELTNPTTIIEKIPGAGIHDGGRIRFGPDNFLYVATGDGSQPSLAQDKNSLAGKILRLTDTGDQAPGNPFNNKVYSFGHRNPQGLTWDNTNILWAPEHGPSAHDELNRITPGNNYGWPLVTGTQTQEGLTPPQIQSEDKTWAPSGAVYYDNAVYFAGLRSNTLFKAEIENNTVKDLKEYFVGEFGRLRGITLGPDNMLYITTSNRDGRGIPSGGDDKIIRVNPEKL